MCVTFRLLKQQLTEREARHRELLREVREAETALRMANESLQSERQAHAQIKTRRSREQGQVADLEREIQKIWLELIKYFDYIYICRSYQSYGFVLLRVIWEYGFIFLLIIIF